MGLPEEQEVNCVGIMCGAGASVPVMPTFSCLLNMYYVQDLTTAKKTASWRVQVTIDLGFELRSSDLRPHVPHASWPSASLGFRSYQPYTEGDRELLQSLVGED